jgi:hypothetical protein
VLASHSPVEGDAGCQRDGATANRRRSQRTRFRSIPTTHSDESEKVAAFSLEWVVAFRRNQWSPSRRNRWPLSPGKRRRVGEVCSVRQFWPELAKWNSPFQALEAGELAREISKEGVRTPLGMLQRRNGCPAGDLGIWGGELLNLAGTLSTRVRRFLCRRHKLRVSGTSRFGFSEIHGKAGVIDIRQRRLQGRPVHALL